MNKQFFLFYIINILLLFGCSQELPPQKPQNYKNGNYQFVKKYMNWLIPRKMKTSEIVGLSMAIVDDQKVTWSKGYGFSNKFNNIKANPKTIYNIGSVSKLFTATAIMQLEENGVLNIDDPFKRYVKSFSIQSHFKNNIPITTRSILTHHSGLPSDIYKHYVCNKAIPKKNYNKMFMNLPNILKYEYVTNPPNTIFSYSNIGYSLLGVLISQLSTMSYEDFIRKNLFNPLHMELSDFRKTKQNSFLFSTGYSYGKKTPFPLIRDIPAGGINSNVLEISNFIKMVLANGKFNNQKIIKVSTLKEMTKVQNENIPLDLDFKIGLGYWIHYMNKEKLIFHGGDLPPYHALLMILPKSKLGTIILVNSGNNTIDGTLWNIAKKCLELSYEEKFNKKMIQENSKNNTTQIPKNKLNKYVGNYSTMMGLVTIFRAGNKLKIKLFNTVFLMQPTNKAQFVLKYDILGLFPIEIDALKILSLTFQDVKGETVFGIKAGNVLVGIGTKIKPVNIPESWIQRIGKYKIISQTNSDPIRSFEIVYNEKEKILLANLILKIGQEMKISLPIQPVTDKEAIIMGKGRNLGETIKAIKINQKSVSEEVLKYSGYTMKKVE